jgi:hypothetical protein
MCTADRATLTLMRKVAKSQCCASLGEDHCWLLIPHLGSNHGKREEMGQIKIIHDPIGETLTIYWDDPEHEKICEEIGQGIILIKDAQGEIVGFERLYFRPSNPSQDLEVILHMPMR